MLEKILIKTAAVSTYMFDDVKVLLGTLGTVFGVSVFGTYQVMDEDWNNQPTDQTETVLSELEMNINQIHELETKKDIEEKRLDVFMNDHADKDYEIGSDDWVEYMIAKETMTQTTSEYQAEFNQITSDVKTTLLTSPDIPENQFHGWVDEFERASNTDYKLEDISANALRECQMDISMPEDRENEIAACTKNETSADVMASVATGGGAAIMLEILLGILSLKEDKINNWANRRREKKKVRRDQKRRIN